MQFHTYEQLMAEVTIQYNNKKGQYPHMEYAKLVIDKGVYPTMGCYYIGLCDNTCGNCYTIHWYWYQCGCPSIRINMNGVTNIKQLVYNRQELLFYIYLCIKQHTCEDVAKGKILHIIQQIEEFKYPYLVDMLKN